MRVSTSYLALVSIDAMNTQRTKLSRSQMQVSTGERLTAPADDPYNAGRILDMDESISVISQYTENSTFAEVRNSLEEGTLDAVMIALQRLRELAVYANNDTHNFESRKSIQEEAILIREQIISLANTRDSANEFLFSGYQGNTKPFDKDPAGNVLYLGDDGQRFLKIGSSTEVAAGDDGAGTFMEIKNGNGVFQTREDPANAGSGIIETGTVTGTYVPGNYTIKFLPSTNPAPTPTDPMEYYVLDTANNVIVPAWAVGSAEAAFLGGLAWPGNTGVPYPEPAVIQGLDALGIQTVIHGEPSGAPSDAFYITPSQNRSVFDIAQDFINALVSPQTADKDKAYFHNSVNRVLADIDQVMDNVNNVRARIGARLHTIDKQGDINESYELQIKTTLSSIKDIDYAEAITRMNLEMVGLQAAQQSYANIQNLSLFNYI